MRKSRIFSYGIILTASAIATILIHCPQYVIKITGVSPTADASSYEQVFSNIYANDTWTNGSGVGSIPANAKPYIALLQQYFDDPKYQTIVDLGCGDWQIMQNINIPADKTYIGVDVVPPIIAALQKQYTKPNVKFVQITSLRDLKNLEIKGDLLVVKDVLQHWPIKEIQYFLANVLPRFKYALITNDCLPLDNLNSEMKLGGYRALDLTKKPFNQANITEVLIYDGPEHKAVSLYVNPNTNPITKL